jgi:hypothetical protein|tara:strand:+ start:606 stop:896 length:291 start_codon:yes stop_codon:yes gene_type:complete
MDENNIADRIMEYGEQMRLLGKLEQEADASQASYYPQAQKEVDRQKAEVAKTKLAIVSAKTGTGKAMVEFENPQARKFLGIMGVAEATGDENVKTS